MSNNERDELAELIWGVEADEVGTFKTGVTSKAADKIANAILAAGWRPPTPPAHSIEPRDTRTVTTADGLDALMAKAWDEGEQAGAMNYAAEEYPEFKDITNPYRSQA